MRPVFLLFFCLHISACQSIPKLEADINVQTEAQPLAKIPFEFLANTFVVVETIAGKNSRHRFLLDTGAGFDAVSATLCKNLKCKTDGKLTGKRMRGDEVTLGLTTLETLEFGQIQKSKWEVGVTSLFDEIPAELGKIEGALSLKFFAAQPFTIDFPERQILIESSASLKKRVSVGKVVKAKLYSQLPKTLGMFVAVNAFGETGSFEVDTGNMTTILPQKHLDRLGIDRNSPRNKVIKNNQMNRVYATVDGKISLAQAPEIHNLNPKICFEDIIYDGVIGIDFLKDKIVTFDVPNARIIFSEH